MSKSHGHLYSHHLQFLSVPSAPGKDGITTVGLPPKCQSLKGEGLGLLLEDEGSAELQAGGGAMVTNAGHRLEWSSQRGGYVWELESPNLKIT